MTALSSKMKAANTLRRLIAENYETQQDFAEHFGTDIRTVSRYINEGISKVDVIQELAVHFCVRDVDFFVED